VLISINRPALVFIKNKLNYEHAIYQKVQINYVTVASCMMLVLLIGIRVHIFYLLFMLVLCIYLTRVSVTLTLNTYFHLMTMRKYGSHGQIS